MKLRKLASVVAVATALIVGGAPIAAAVEGYQLVPGAGASAEEVHEAIMGLPSVPAAVATPVGPVTSPALLAAIAAPSSFTLPDSGVTVTRSTAVVPTIVGGTLVIPAPAAITATVATWALSPTAVAAGVPAAVVTAVSAGAQAQHISTEHSAFTGVYMIGENGLLTPLTRGTTPNAFGGFGDATTGDYHTMSGSTVIVLNRSFLETIQTGHVVELTAVFDGVAVESHAVAIHAVGIDATTTQAPVGGDNNNQAGNQGTGVRPVHPATGPATLLYAVGGLLLAGGGAALVNSAKRRKAENV